MTSDPFASPTGPPLSTWAPPLMAHLPPPPAPPVELSGFLDAVEARRALRTIRPSIGALVVWFAFFGLMGLTVVRLYLPPSSPGDGLSMVRVLVPTLAAVIPPIFLIARHDRLRGELRRRLEDAQPAGRLSFRLGLTPRGLEIGNERGGSIVEWHTVRSLHIRRGHFTVIGRGGPLFVPVAITDANAAFLEQLRWFVGWTSPGAVATSSSVASKRTGFLIMALVAAVAAFFLVALQAATPQRPVFMCPEGQFTIVTPAADPNSPPVVTCIGN